MTTTKNQVRWTKSESERVEKEAIHLYAIGATGNHDEILQKAQGFLSVERRRNYISLNSTIGGQWRKKNILAKVKHIKVIPAPSQPITGITPPAMKKEENDTRMESPVLTKYKGLINPDVFEGMVLGIIEDNLPRIVENEVGKVFASLKLEEVVTAAFSGINLKERVESELAKFSTKLSVETIAFMDLLQDMLNQKAQKISQPVIVSSGNLKIGNYYRIGVVSVLQSQTHHIRHALDKYNFDIEFFTSDAKKEEPVNPRLNKVFLMTKFMSHSRSDQIKSIYASEDIIYINGGLFTLTQKIINTLYPSEQK